MSTEFRKEIKYICTQGQLLVLKNKLLGCGCKLDPYGDEEGTYIIRSVYFDDCNDSCYWENVNGESPREKFRIRIYNGKSSMIKLECKRKERDLTHKESCSITEEECRCFIAGEVPYRDNPPNLFKKFGFLIQHKSFRPKVIVEYERTAFVYTLGNVRVTFDRCISSSQQFGGFLDGNIVKRPVMPTNMHIVEVKYDELLPDYIYNSLQADHMKRSAYSKYCVCRKFGIGR